MSGAPTLCAACQHEQTALPEPARTALLVVVSFAAGVLFAGFMYERAQQGLACFPEHYERIEQ